VNPAKLIFKAPGTNQFHGSARYAGRGEGHLTKCYLNARTRVGASFHAGFHYDCQPHGGGRLSDHYDSCHGQLAAVARGRRHVNIAPNDYVR